MIECVFTGSIQDVRRKCRAWREIFGEYPALAMRNNNGAAGGVRDAHDGETIFALHWQNVVKVKRARVVLLVDGEDCEVNPDDRYPGEGNDHGIEWRMRLFGDWTAVKL